MQAPPVRQTIEQFDKMIRTALETKYRRLYGEHYERLLRHNSILRWDLLKLLESCEQSGIHPASNVEGFLYRLMDFKLQMYYIMEVDLGLYNTQYHSNPRCTDDETPPADLLLTRLSFDQNLIGKSRIVWERLMQSIYYLENGRSIEARSVKKKFFQWVRRTPRWRFLEPYEGVIERYDSSFRTPEFHKHSILRAELFGSRKIDPNDLLEPLNRATNVIWENVSAIVAGGTANSFTDLHFVAGSDFGIDPRYLDGESPTAST
jgi:hypothetical protein